MNFDSLAEFVAMGRHGAYVWSSYGLTFATVIVLVLLPWRRRRAFMAAQARRLRREAQHGTAAAGEGPDGRDDAVEGGADPAGPDAGLGQQRGTR